jgi:hypothetical protein
MTEVPRIPKVLTNRFTIFYLPCSPVIHLDGSRNSTLFFNGTLVGHASGTCQQQITKRFGTVVHFLVHLYNFSFIYNYTYISIIDPMDYIDYIDRIDYIAIEHADFRFQGIQTQVGDSDSDRTRLQVRAPPPAPQ